MPRTRSAKRSPVYVDQPPAEPELAAAGAVPARSEVPYAAKTSERPPGAENGQTAGDALCAIPAFGCIRRVRYNSELNEAQIRIQRVAARLRLAAPSACRQSRPGRQPPPSFEASRAPPYIVTVTSSIFCALVFDAPISIRAAESRTSPVATSKRLGIPSMNRSTTGRTSRPSTLA